MNCPFCQSEVSAKAYVCGHCGRDLVPLLSLMGQIEQQAQHIERLEKYLGLPPNLTMVVDTVDLSLQDQDLAPPAVAWHIQRLLWWVLLAVASLIFAHWLLLFVYDASLLILRVVTMLIPLSLGLIANAKGDIDWRSNIGAALLLAWVGVAAMLGLTAWIDEVSWLPQNKRDWIETFEFAMAIMLAWVTGHLIGASLTRGQRLLHDRRLQARAQGKAFVPKVTELTEQLHKLALSAAPVVSGAVAAYSGLKSIMGDG